jgi:hypothetical protein
MPAAKAASPSGRKDPTPFLEQVTGSELRFSGE